MTHHTAEQFLEKIQKLNIEVSTTSDGVFTACSESEPHFCFDGYSQSEVAERVVEALTSYAKVYFGIEGLNLRSNRQDVPRQAVQFEAPTTISKLALAVA